MVFIQFYILFITEQFLIFSFICSSPPYESCERALLANNGQADYYDLKMRDGDKSSLVFCQSSNDTHFISILGNNYESPTLIEGHNEKVAYNVQYGNFTTEDIDKFRKISGVCQQEMSLYLYRANPYDSHFVFWDGSIIRADNSSDEICICLISEICIKRQSVTENCDVKFPDGPYSHRLNTSGLMSVDFDRLPIKELHLGDTAGNNDGQREYIIISIGKYTCKQKFKFNTKLENYPHCSDGKNDYQRKFLICSSAHFRYMNFNIKQSSFLKIIKFMNESSKCEDIRLLAELKDGSSSECMKKTHCLFECESFIPVFFRLKISGVNCPINNV